MTIRVLVTGATGLIGRQVVPALVARGLTVIATTRSDTDVPGAETVQQCDLLNASDRSAALRAARATHMIHLAWFDAPRDRMGSPENLDWASATLSLVRDFAATGGKRVVAAGSCAEYDWSYEVLREDTPLNASSPYGRAKARTGQLLCETMPEQGLSLAWARIFFCYGPGEPRGRLVGDLVRAVTNGEPVDCTDGLQVRDYMHTADVANALVTVLMSDLIGPVNIASGKGTAVGDIIDQLGQLSGQAELFRIGARARPADDPPRLVGDVSKLKSLGFLPEFDLARGLRDCLKRVDGAIQ